MGGANMIPSMTIASAFGAICAPISSTCMRWCRGWTVPSMEFTTVAVPWSTGRTAFTARFRASGDRLAPGDVRRWRGSSFSHQLGSGRRDHVARR